MILSSGKRGEWVQVMTGPLPSASESLTPDARRRIADVCTRFDHAWTAGLNPRIEDFLCLTWPPGERGELLSALLEVEFYYRQQAGETLDPDEYLQRFPDQADTRTLHLPMSGSASPRTPEPYARGTQASEAPLLDHYFPKQLPRNGRIEAERSKRETPRAAPTARPAAPRNDHRSLKWPAATGGSRRRAQKAPERPSRCPIARG